MAGFDAAHKRMIDWLAPSLDALPPFALVPATDGRIAGLSLFFGRRSALGVHYGLEFNVPAIITPIGEQFLPASVLAPYLAPPYRDLFGGEAVRLSDLQRERAELVTTISGSSAVMLTEDQKPGKTLTFRAEAPASFFKDDVDRSRRRRRGAARSPGQAPEPAALRRHRQSGPRRQAERRRIRPQGVFRNDQL